VLGGLLIPAFLILDWVIMPPDKLGRFFAYRALVTGLIAIQWVFIRRTAPTRWSVLHGYFLTFIAGFMISWMTVDLGGFDSRYYAGLMLVVVAVNLLLPWRPVHSAANGFLTVGMYVVLGAAFGGPFEVANLVSDAMRDIERRDSPYLEAGGLEFNASFILGGQIAGEDMRLFRLYAEGNFIEAGRDTPFLQTGEAKYGKPILDLAVTASATMEDATKCVLVSFDSTMLSNLSVGMPIDLLCYADGSLHVTMQRRFDEGDAYFTALTRQWLTGTRKVFRELPLLAW
jgi:hypothetical protein